MLNFTQTKVFFNAKNEGVDWAGSCEIIDSVDSIKSDTGIIINSGEIVTTTFREKFPNVDCLIDCREHQDLIKFSPDYSYQIHKRPPYPQGSKQLYILENLYKVVIKAKKLIYLDNTEDYTCPSGQYRHFYGLASGWKSIRYVKDLGINNLESITIYDVCERQLEFQKYLHSFEKLPGTASVPPPTYGQYDPPNDIKEFWPQWHKTRVNFEIIDLFKTPVFPEQSFVWISNVFKYEPSIFALGWQACQFARDKLFLENKSCIIIER